MVALNALKRNWDSAILLSIILATLILYISSLRTDHDWGGDFAQYISQAASLSEGSMEEMMRLSAFRFDNSDNSIRLGPKLYAWGYPVLLAPVYHFYGLNMIAMKIVTSAFYLLSLPIIYLIFKNRLRSAHGLLLVALMAFNPSMFSFKENIRVDFPLMFFTLLSIYLIQRFLIESKCWINQAFSLSLLGASIFLAFFFKGNGILLLPCLFLVQLVEFRSSWRLSELDYRKVSIHLIPYLVFFILAVLANFLFPQAASSYGEIVHYFSLYRLLGNIAYYAFLLSKFFAIPAIALGIILYLFTTPFFFMGLVKRLKSDYFYAAFIAFTLALFILYPGRQGLRYIFPIIPFYLYFSFIGMESPRIALLDRLKGKRIPAFIGMIILMLFMHGIGAIIHANYSASKTVDGPYTKESMELFHYIKEYTPKDCAIIFFKPRVMTLYTGRLAARTTSFDRAVNCGASYFVFKRGSGWNLIIKGHEQELAKLFSNSEFTLYGLKARKNDVVR
jgi:hypothetical protein